MFWSGHDPTLRPWSTQYKAVLWYHDDQQRAAALAARDRIASVQGTDVHTELLPAPTFWRAEDDHQKYRLRSRDDLEQRVRDLYDSEAEFVDSTLAARLNALLAGYEIDTDEPELSEAERALLRSLRP